MNNADNPPLILTLQLDTETHRFFTEQRTRFFPEALNFLEAHVTLFHRLPSESVVQITKDVTTIAASLSPFVLEVTGLRNLGRGVAYSLTSRELLRLREELAQSWSDWLTAQDRQRFAPHVTVQNKVTPEQAHETLSLLQTGFTRRTAEAVGLALWRYDGGPWHLLQVFPFG